MRLTDFPLIEEVKQLYMDLRRDGKNRTNATEMLIREYADELTIGVEDDGQQFWIGLADGQYQAKELTVEVAEKGLAALTRLQDMVPDITIGDIERRRERYALAPMPERKIRKANKFRCPWNIGDTFAYQLSGKEAEELGIAGKYMLFRKVDEREFDKGRIVPMVTVSLWDGIPFPSTAQEFQSVPLLRIDNGGRCDSPEDKYEYRALITIKSLKQLLSLPLQFVGNFQDTVMPKDEIIFQNAGHCTLLLPEMMDSSCCVFWKMHLYCTNNQQA